LTIDAPPACARYGRASRVTSIMVVRLMSLTLRQNARSTLSSIRRSTNPPTLLTRTIDAAEESGRRLHHGDGGAFVGQVGLEMVGPPPERFGQGDQFPRSLFAHVVMDGEIASGFEQTLGDGLADPLFRPGDQRAFPDQ